jgi:hypothetical protein
MSWNVTNRSFKGYLAETETPSLIYTLILQRLKAGDTVTISCVMPWGQHGTKIAVAGVLNANAEFTGSLSINAGSKQHVINSLILKAKLKSEAADDIFTLKKLGDGEWNVVNPVSIAEATAPAQTVLQAVVRAALEGGRHVLVKVDVHGQDAKWPFPATRYRYMGKAKINGEGKIVVYGELEDPRKLRPTAIDGVEVPELNEEDADDVFTLKKFGDNYVLQNKKDSA